MKTSEHPLAARLRAAADTIQKRIDHGNRDMTQALTPKRSRQYKQRTWEAANLERAQRAMRALADGHDRGDLPDELAGLVRLAEIAPLVHKGTLPGGYYDWISSPDYRDTSAAGRALQSLVDAGDRPAGRLAAEIHRREMDARLAALPGFYPTPASVALRMARLAEIQAGDRVLEPSAGSGRLIDAIFAASPGASVDACETSPMLRELLELKRRALGLEPGRGRLELVADDCLELAGPPRYDVVVMNPPFEKAADIRHVTHAWSELLRPGGRLVAIVSDGALYRGDKAARAFRELVGEAADDPDGVNLPGGTFDDTNVPARIIVLRKPAELAAAAPENAADEATADGADPCSCRWPQLPLFYLAGDVAGGAAAHACAPA